ncbi:copper homeostasis protein CutC [Georgenia satyanarayanai]|uniref:copper homeostasis protein CutC n=1 Tax=Georgenia satyanarayanai TaxID=860221 RepID=UPI00203C894A|nr:copper homeostasis protein CutC [Georgenia satyanarayanai]MCM3660331.1 copper homeostasis protein CutC [Georgenia satyanarayanai]
MGELQVEVAVQDASGAALARDTGADRVELCSALDVGGLTPSIAMVEAVVATGVPVHVLVRPRPGGFRYSATEVSLMVRDIEALVDAGAAGVVVGALTAKDTLDRHALEALQYAAEGLEVTAHRCVDVLPDPAAALDDLASLGFTRVLTSGGAPTVADGVPTLRRMVEAAGGRVQVMAGGGLRPEDVPALGDAGVDAVHLSARRHIRDGGPSGPGGGDPGYDVTDRDILEAVRAALAGR